MKNLLFLSLVLFPTILYAQNLFKLEQISRNIFREVKYPIIIQRTSVIEYNQLAAAIETAAFQSSFRHQEQLFKTSMISENERVLYLNQSIKQFKCSEENLYGPYSYVKICASVMGSKKKELSKDILPLINLSFLKELYSESLYRYETKHIKNYPFFNQFVANTPSIVHSHTRLSLFRSIFDTKIQKTIYLQDGIKGILDYTFNRINTFNVENQLPVIPNEFIEGTYKEAKLWAIHYGLKWK